MTLETTYTLTLKEHEAHALKKLLGSMNDQEFSNFGISGDDRETMGEIYDAIPYIDDE
jgi:hypothetical protein